MDCLGKLYLINILYRHRNYKYEELVNKETFFCSDIKNQSKSYILWDNESAIKSQIKTGLDEYYRVITQKHIFLNNETILFLLKLMRTFLFNKGHLILIGGTLLGKQSICQFAAFLQKRSFAEYDENLLDKSFSQIEALVKKHLTEITFKNLDYVLYFKDKLIKKVNLK